MTTVPAIPGKDPADDGTLTGLLKTAIDVTKKTMHGQLPCRVLAYDRASNRATVQPLITMLRSNGQTVSRAQIASVPVLALGGGGYTITFPLKRGDLGWIEASDRDISLFLQTMQESPVNATKRFHDFSDGRFVPDSFAQWSFDAADDSSSMVIQSWDGTVKIALDPAKIRMKAPSIEIDTNDFEINAQNSVNIFVGAAQTTALALTPATLSMTSPAIGMTNTGGAGETQFFGNPVRMPDAVIANVTFSTHLHGGVQTGTGNTSTPHN